MNNTAKKIAFIAVSLLVLVVVFNMFSRKGKVEKDNTFVVEQQRIYQDQLRESGEQLERLKKYYKTAEELQNRQEKLIVKWEEQARRTDAILLKLEKNNN